MRLLHLLTPRQVSNRATQLENAVMSLRAQIHLRRRIAQQLATGIVQRTEPLHLIRPHIAVDQQVGLVRPGKVGLLYLACRFHLLLDDRRRLATLREASLAMGTHRTSR
jgi:hypothetical protein